MFKIIILILIFLVSCTQKDINNKKENSKKEITKVPIEIQKAVQNFNDGKVDLAYKEFVRLIKKYPNSWELNYYIGMIAAKGQNLKMAEKYLGKAIEISPKGWQSYKEMAALYKSNYEYKKALEMIKKVFKYEQNDALSNFMMAFLAIRVKDKSIDPIKYYSQAIKSQPKYILAYIHFGQYYYSIKDYTNAEKIWKSALKVNDSITIKRMLASLAIKDKRYEIAKKRYKDLIEENNNYFEGYFKLGEIFEKIGDLKSAENIYKEGMKLKGLYPYIKQALANLYQKQSRYKEAINLYEILYKESYKNKEFYLFKQAEIFKKIKNEIEYNKVIDKLKKMKTDLSNSYLKSLM